MKKVKQIMLPPDEIVVNKIYMVGSKKVMIDRDLAEL